MQTLHTQEVRAEWHLMCAFTVTIRQAWYVSRAVYFVFFSIKVDVSTSLVDTQVETNIFSILNGQVHAHGEDPFELIAKWSWRLPSHTTWPLCVHYNKVTMIPITETAYASQCHRVYAEQWSL